MPSRAARARLLRPSVLLSSVALPFCFALTGCQTYTEQTQSRDEALRNGNIASAVAQADKDAEKNASNKDAILYRLEQGAILRAAALANLPATPGDAAPAPASAAVNQTQTNTALNSATEGQIAPRISWLTRSIAAFDDAARRIDDYEAAAKVSASSETAALFTNQANLHYR